jgi:hypothetical protein
MNDLEIHKLPLENGLRGSVFQANNIDFANYGFFAITPSHSLSSSRPTGS